MNLDDDLAAWAAAIRLSEAEAETVYARVRQELPAMLEPRWWRGFNADLTATIIASTRPHRLAA